MKNQNSASLRNVRFSNNTVFLVLQVTFILKPASDFTVNPTKLWNLN